MKALLQRVSEAKVSVAGETVAAIEQGLLILLCVLPGDDSETAERLAGKIAKLRIFPDADGKMNLSVIDAGGAALVVSQFTLAADAKKGNRPSFTGAAPPDQARHLCAQVSAALRALGLTVAEGRFGADMKVGLVNDGPVTILLDSDAI